jgi:hypothetical protein
MLGIHAHEGRALVKDPSRQSLRDVEVRANNDNLVAVLHEALEQRLAEEAPAAGHRYPHRLAGQHAAVEKLLRSRLIAVALVDAISAPRYGFNNVSTDAATLRGFK